METTLPGNPHVKHRHRRTEDENGVGVTERYTREVPRPRMIENHFKQFSTIDVHDHLRQGSLRMEEAWQTQKWWHRIFATILGVTDTDCFLAYRYEKTGFGLPHENFTMFLGKLSYEQIHNVYLEEAIRLRQEAAAAVEQAQRQLQELRALHRSRSLLQHPNYAHFKGTSTRPRLNCKACNKKAYFYCVKCTDEQGRFIPFCNPNATTCFQNHLPTAIGTPTL